MTLTTPTAEESLGEDLKNFSEASYILLGCLDSKLKILDLEATLLLSCKGINFSNFLMTEHLVSSLSSLSLILISDKIYVGF